VEVELATLRKAVETSGEVIFLTDKKGIISYVNPEFTRLYGHDAKEVVGLTTPRILKSGTMTAGYYKRFWETLLNKKVVKGKFINKCVDGRLVTIEGSASPILDDGGEIVGFLAIQRDITQREQTEEKNRQRNKELAALNAIATTVSQSLNLNQILNGALDEVLKLDMFESAAKGMLFRLDEEKGELVLIAHRGAPEEHPCLAKAPELGECLCGLCAQQGKAIISNDCLQDKRHDRVWPQMPEHRDICLPLKVRGKILGVMNVRLPTTHEISVHDVELLTSVADQIGVAIENARLFEAVSRQHERLRTLSLRLAEAEESERRRLAQELHDQVGQKLTALGINLNIIRAEMPNNGPQKLYDCLAESQDLVEQTSRLIRGVMSDLRPPMLDDLGLVETLHWYGDQIASRTGLSVIVKSGGHNLDLPTHIESALFRITQEALSNVVKHAQAAEVRITVETIDESVRLIIADDGIGYCPDRLAEPVGDRGWGLLIMAERAEAVGGRCWIESHRPEGGARVIAEVLQ
jgi:PAS domain S-box-containing protein